MIEDNDQDSEIIAETEDYFVLRSNDPELGLLFHVGLGGITLHLNSEEWDELVVLIKAADSGS